jgi:hypothetical protein
MTTPEKITEYDYKKDPDVKYGTDGKILFDSLPYSERKRIIEKSISDMENFERRYAELKSREDK